MDPAQAPQEISREWVTRETRRPMLLKMAADMGLELEDESIPSLRKSILFFIDNPSQLEVQQNMATVLPPPRPGVAANRPAPPPPPPARPGPATPPPPPGKAGPPAPPAPPRPAAPPAPAKAAPPAPPRPGAPPPPVGAARPPAPAPAPAPVPQAADLEGALLDTVAQLRELQSIVFGVDGLVSFNHETNTWQIVWDAVDTDNIRSLAYVFGGPEKASGSYLKAGMAPEALQAVLVKAEKEGQLFFHNKLPSSEVRSAPTDEELTGGATDTVDLSKVAKMGWPALGKLFAQLFGAGSIDPYKAAGDIQAARDALLQAAQPAPLGEEGVNIGPGSALLVAFPGQDAPHQAVFVDGPDEGPWNVNIGGTVYPVDPGQCSLPG